MADKLYHHALTISNIKNLIPITLNIKDAQYNSWAHLFKIHCTAYDVLDHILPTTPAATDSSSSVNTNDSTNTTKDALWYHLNAIVLQWIYDTISNDLLSNILEEETTAAGAWICLQNTFQDNKNSRALYLQRQFNTICLDDFPDCAAYCQEIKVIADQLRNVGDKVSDNRMVLQLIASLNDNFDTIGTYFTQLTDLPSFYEAKSKLLVEETRKTKQIINNLTHKEAALLTTASQKPSDRFNSPIDTNSAPPPNRNPDRYNSSNSANNQTFRYNNGRGRGRGNSYQGRNNRSRGRFSSQNAPSQNWNRYPSWMYASPPWAS
ncbi:uncharacterized protein [Rutidosis leptorrhynchoides]|uniref:uncharacterized protein n=1 Tax=Rutidosis leptorrhynchoides TaxID=125765 RepID=UPI003A9997E5